MASSCVRRAVCALSIALAAMAQPVPSTISAHATAGQVLILGSTVAGGASSIEAQEAQAQGYSVNVVDNATWSSMTSADFASYAAIILGDPHCSDLSSASAAQGNTSTWESVLNGNIEILGTDPVFHDSQGGDAVTRKAVDFALGQPGRTGAYIALSCYYAGAAANTPVPLLDGLSPGGFSVGGAGCSDRIHIVGTSPALAESSDATLSNWSCSVHEAFNSWPSSFAVLAIDLDLGANYTAPDGTTGEPYIIVSPATAVAPTSPTTLLGAFNASTNKTSCDAGGSPINCATGNFWHTFTDLTIPGRGPAIDFERTYNAQASGAASPLGFGWSSSYTMGLTVAGATGVVTIAQENGSTVTFSPKAGGYTSPSWVFATLGRNADGTYTFTRRKTQLFTFSASGQLVAERDLNGNTTSLAYNSLGQLVTVTDSAGRAVTVTYGPNGLMAGLHDVANRTVSYGYDSAKNLTSVTDVGGGITKFTYDANHLMLTMTDPNGGVVTNVYDSASRAVKQTDPMGRVLSLSYSSTGTTITDALGHVTVENYVQGQMTSRTMGFGTSQAATWTYTYDPATFALASVTDPNGHVTTSTYDSSSNLLTRTDAQGGTTTYTYNVLNEPTSITDPLGTTTTIAYDSAGDLLSTSTPLNTTQAATTTFAHGDGSHPGDVTARTDPSGNTTMLAYDSAGDLVRVTDPLGHTSTMSYDSIGRPTSQTSPNGNAAGADPSRFTTARTYDPFGRVLTVTDPLGRKTLYAYDATGNLVGVTDGNGHTTTTAFDADNEAVKVTRPDGSTQLTGYDAAGNVVSQTDGLGHTTSYAYDSVSREATVADPLGRVTSYSHDPAGNVTTMVDPVGQKTTYGYDPNNRLTSIGYSDGMTPSVGYAYDADGRRLSMSDGTGTTHYAYDSLGHLTTSTDGAGATVGYGYDLAGRLTTLSYPGTNQVAIRGYDKAGRLTSVKDWLGHTTNFAYDPDGNEVAENSPNSVARSFQYDQTDEMTLDSAKHPGSQNYLWYIPYTYDAAGQVTADDNAQPYTYDANERVASGDTLVNQTYTYDSADRVTSYADSQGLTRTQTFDAADEVLQQSNSGPYDSATTTFTYDPRGNRITSVTPGFTPDMNATGDTWMWNYAYDQANRLQNVAAACSCGENQQIVRYTYDGDGTRMAKTVGTTTESFTYDIVEGLPLIIGDGKTSYVTGPGGLPLEQITPSGATYYYQGDRLGSTLRLLNQQGNTVDDYLYDPYGNLYDKLESVANPFRYAGQYQDPETGFYYLRARYYDPATARFLSRDAMAGRTRAPYNYGSQNPSNHTDRTGNDDSWDPGTAWIGDSVAAVVCYGVGVATWETGPLAVGIAVACGIGADYIQHAIEALNHVDLSGLECIIIDCAQIEEQAAQRTADEQFIAGAFIREIDDIRAKLIAEGPASPSCAADVARLRQLRQGLADFMRSLYETHLHDNGM